MDVISATSSRSRNPLSEFVATVGVTALGVNCLRRVLRERIMSDARYYIVGDHDVWMIKFEDGEYGPCASRDEAVVFAIDAAQRPSDTETGSTRDLFPKSAARDRLGPAPLARQRARGIWTVTFALRSLRAVRPHSLEGERRPAFAAENPRDLRPAKRERRPRCRIRIARNRESRPSAP